MIKKILLSAALLSTGLVQAQSLPTFDMETWVHTPESPFPPAPVYDQPKGWASINLLSGFGNPISVTKVTDAHAVTAARIETVKLTNNPVPTQIPDTAGVLFTGGLDFVKQRINYGFPYTERAEKLQFYSKYTPVGEDNAYVFVFLSKWNSSLGRKDTIGFGQYNIAAASATYTSSDIVINYNPNIAFTQPDSATIIASSSGIVHPKVGSVFFVDDFHFTPPNGIVSTARKNAPLVFPNPVNNVINFSFLPQQVKSIELKDMTGRSLGAYPVKDEKASINTSEFAPGTYFYLLDNGTTGKFNIAR